MLKADLHLHTSEDPKDQIGYSAKELIAVAAKFGYKVLSITNHDMLYYTKELSHYAASKGVLLISGMERTIEGVHVLLYNYPREEAMKLRHLDDLKPGDERLIIAAHPFFMTKTCIGNRLIAHIQSFDGVEFSHFYSSVINLNRKAVAIARKYHKAVIGCSDCHYLSQLNSTYSLIDSEGDIDSVIQAIKSHKLKVVSKPMPHSSFLPRVASIIVNDTMRLVRRKLS